MLGASLHLIVLTFEIMLRTYDLYISILTLILSILLPIKHKKIIDYTRNLQLSKVVIFISHR